MQTRAIIWDYGQARELVAIGVEGCGLQVEQAVSVVNAEMDRIAKLEAEHAAMKRAISHLISAGGSLKSLIDSTPYMAPELYKPERDARLAVWHETMIVADALVMHGKIPTDEQ